MLTRRQKSLLDFLSARLAADKVAPTLAEMATAVGLSGPSSVHHLLKSLEARGFIRRIRNRARAIEMLTDNPTAAARIADSKPAKKARILNDIPLIGAIDEFLPASALTRHGSLFRLPPEITGQGDFLAVRVVTDALLSAGIKRNDVCVFRRQTHIANADTALIRTESRLEIRLCEKTVRKLALKAIDYRHETFPFPRHNTEIIGRLVALVRRL
jgi:repressor LexA